MADPLALRQTIQNAIAASGMSARDLVTVFHAVEWNAPDDEVAVTFCLAMDAQRSITYPPGWGSWVPPVSGAKPPDGPLKVGLHDAGGLEWMLDEGVRGCALVAVQVRDTPVLNLDFTGYAGIDVYLRLGWGYADGSGTIAPPEKISAHCLALADTVNRARGLAGVVLWNEVNNPSEWPGGWPEPSFILSPQYVGNSYRTVCGLVTVSTPLSPPPVDPYNVVAGEYGQPVDPRTWAEACYRAPRVDWIAMHAKTQGSDLGQIDGAASWETFGEPIAGRYQHLRTVEDQLGWIPADLRDRKVVVTELNPQRDEQGELGWGANGAEWARRAVDYLRTIPQIAGAMFYRYEVAGGGQESFGLERRGDVLEAIEMLS